MNIEQIQTSSNWGKEVPRINRNFQNLAVDVEKAKNASTRNKGLFPTETDLKKAVPTPIVGDWAVVGNTIPGTVYQCKTAGTWTNTGQQGGGGEVDLTGYTKETDFTPFKEQTETDIAGIKANTGYLTCTTAAGTAAKTVTKTGFVLSTGCRLVIKMSYANTAASPTLNVNNTGAKPFYYNGSVASYNNTWEAGETVDVYYDGTNFYASNVQGGSGSGGNMILEWNTDVATTRKQVKANKRKAGMQISYLHPDNGWINEQYIGTVTTDTEWSKDDNWEKIPNQSQINYLDDKINTKDSIYEKTVREATSTSNKIVSASDGNLYDNISWTTYSVNNISGYVSLYCNICVSSSMDRNVGIAFFDADGKYISGYYEVVSAPTYKTVKISIPQNASKVMWSIYKGFYSEKDNNKATLLNPSLNTDEIIYGDDTLTNFLDSLKEEEVQILTIESFIKNAILRSDGTILAGAGGSTDSDYVLDFIQVKKDVPIRVLSCASYDKSVLAFYRNKDEKTFVESIKGYDYNNGNSNFKSFIAVNYTPSEDGYIRVSFKDIGIKANDNILFPSVYIGNKSIEQYYTEIKDYNSNFKGLELDGYNTENYKQNIFIKNKSLTDMGSTKDYTSMLTRVCKGYKITSYSNAVSDLDTFQFLQDDDLNCTYSVLGKGDTTVVTDFIAPSDGYILVGYDVNRGNSVQGGIYNGKTLPYLKIEQSSGNEDDKTTTVVNNIEDLDGVENHNLPNLFNKDDIKAYDSDFANKVFEKIGRKTDNTGCYSNNIECKEGDWFTRSDFGTGIIVALDSAGNILGDVANAAYQPTVQIVPSDSDKYDFSTIKYVVFVVPLTNLEDEKIVKAKYMPTGEGDFITIPKLQVRQANIPLGLDYFIKSKSGRYYSLIVDDSGETPELSFIQQDGIPMSELPNDFPTFTVEGSFSEYYDSLIFCPVEGGVSNYLYELSPTGLVKRYIKQKVNCPRILKEGDTWYYYGVNGSLNSSSGKLNIYKGNGETFELVKGNLGNSKGQVIEPHDCLVLSVNPLHYICQRYIPNTTTIVDGESKIITSLHVEEIYEGKSVWEWHSEDYGELWKDSHKNTNNYDYLHNNTISIDKDGNLCLNCKTANQILVIKRTWSDETHTGTIGDILWKIGGNSTNEGYDVPTRIKTTSEQQWYESHDAVPNSNGIFTMYDNKESGPSRILEFGIDTETKVLTDFKKYIWNTYRGRYMGSVDKVSEGIFLVSWGSFREGNAANAGIYNFNTQKKIFEIRFDATGSSAYRVYGIKKEG